MSKSSSTGDLVPRDITEIMALQNKVSKGSKKKRGSSVGRAFSWFKGNNPKRNVSNGQGQSGSLGGLTGETTINRQFRDNPEAFKAGQKQDEPEKLAVHYKANQHYQENVFIEGSRPKYLEDLHTEALEGLKILQQEEENNGKDISDNQSSTGRTQEKHVNSQVKDGHFSFDFTTNPGASSASTVSALSSRPVLTRQGSTFKPLNTVKKVEKTKKRNRRTTIMGIPQQVQKELCMGRELLHKVSLGEDGDSSGTVTITAVDGEAPVTNQDGVRVQLQHIEALQISREEQLLNQHLQAVYRDELLRNLKSGTQSSNMQRPKSLAVPGLTTSSTFLQEPQGPVMSISPQATYLSTIIPNAILPSAIDVIEIDRSCNRRSVRPSLASASPSSTRSGGGAHDDPRSSSSKWSSSQSSETVVSNPSTTSFKGIVPPLQFTESVKEINSLNEEKISINSSVSWSSFTSKAASQKVEYEEPGNARETARNGRLFSRNHSVMKAKLPPAPPPRKTNSDQYEKHMQSTNEIRDTRDLSTVDRQEVDEVFNAKGNLSSIPDVISTNTSVLVFLNDSNQNTHVQEPTGAQTEANDPSLRNRFERTVSPSSGYSSQSGTPTHSSKDISPISPGRHKGKPPKPERISARISPVMSVSSSLVSLSSAMANPVNQLSQTHTNQSQPQEDATVQTPRKITEATATTLRDLFTIPPPPKIKAPCPPPPETWAHNKRTTELLCGPAPSAHRIHQLQKHKQKPVLLSETQVSTKNSDQSTEKMFIESNEPLPVHEQWNQDLDIKNTKNMVVKENEECTNQDIQNKECKALETQTFDQESTVTLIKLPTAGNVNQRVPTPTEPFKSESDAHGTSIPVLEDKYLTKCFIKNEIPVMDAHKCCVESSGTTSHLHSSSIPEYQNSELEKDLQPEIEFALFSVESSWPPPPPPLVEPPDVVFEGQDEVDFPPPPPMEELLAVTDNCSTQKAGDHLSSREGPELSDKASDTKLNADTQIIVNTLKMAKLSNDSLDDDLPKIPMPLEDKAVPEVNSNSECSNTHEFSEISIQSQEALEIQPAQSDSFKSNVHAEDLSQETSQASELNKNISETDSLFVEDLSTVNFKRQPSLTNKERCKDVLTKNQPAPIPKEDANIPLVTPSLLQMVRLRSVNDQTNQDHNNPETLSDQSASSQVTPQKPIRKSMQVSTKSPASSATPSMCLQEAIRKKTAAMSPIGIPTRLRHQQHLPTSTVYSNQVPVASLNSLGDMDLHKSPASTASFIFSKSGKKVVIETPTSPGVQENVRQNLEAELMQISEQTKVTNGTNKPIKVPPPIAKKPIIHVTILSDKVGTAGTPTPESSSSTQEKAMINNDQGDRLQPEKLQVHSQEKQASRNLTETGSISEVY